MEKLKNTVQNLKCFFFPLSRGIKGVLLLILFLLPSPSHAQQNCNRTQFNTIFQNAQQSLKAKDYKAAINKFFAALKICPQEEKAVMAQLDAAFKSIEADRDRAKSESRKARKAERDAKLSQKEAERESQRARKAEKDARIAQEEAEHLAHASNNSALAIRTIRTDPTLALRIAEFNYKRYPENEAAAVALRETFNSETPFYKKEIKYPKYVTSVAYLPDGEHFLIGRRGGVIEGDLGAYRLELYDKEGNFVRSLITESISAEAYGDVEDLAISVQNDLVITGSYADSVAILSNLEGEIQHIFKGHDFSSVALSPDGKYVLTGDDDTAAHLWSTETGELLRVFEENYSTDLRFSPDGESILISEGDFASLKKLDGSPISFFSGGGGFYMISVRNAFSPDGELIATGGSAPALWAKDGKKRADLAVEKGYISALDFTPDGKHILGASSIGEVIVWDKKGKQLSHFKAHNREINSLAFSPDGKHFLTAGGGDLSVKLWNWQTKLLQDFGQEGEYANPIGEVAFHPTGKEIFASYMEGVNKKWDIDSGADETIFQEESSLSRICAFSPSGKFALTGRYPDSVAILWDNQTGERLHTFYGHHSFEFPLFGTDSLYPASVTAACFSKDEKKLLTAGSDRVVNLWDLESKELITKIKVEDYGITKVAFTPEEDILFYTKDRSLKRYNQQGELLQLYKGHSNRIHALAISPDGKLIVSGSEKGEILMHNKDGKLLKTILLPEEWIYDLAFSPDGKYFLSCSDKARIWDLHGLEIQEFNEHNLMVQSGAFSPDGKYVVTADYEGSIHIWPSIDHILETSVAPLQLGELLKAGLSLSEKDFLALAQDIESREETFLMYKYAKKQGLDLDLVDLVLSKENTASGIHAYIEIIHADFSAFTRENMSLMIKYMQGDYSDWVVIYRDIYQLIEQAIPLVKNQENFPIYAAHISDYAWGQMITGDIQGAAESLEKGLEIQVSNKYLLGKLAHLRLLEGNYQKAKAMYLEYAPKAYVANEPYRNFAELFLSDFGTMERADILSEKQEQEISELKELLSQFKEKE